MVSARYLLVRVTYGSRANRYASVRSNNRTGFLGRNCAKSNVERETELIPPSDAGNGNQPAITSPPAATSGSTMPAS